jgi:hypothetical protein
MGNILISSNKYYPNSTPGYSFAASGDTVTIAPGVLVGSAQGSGVVCGGAFNGDSLINNGKIQSTSNFGVEFFGSNGKITNNIGGQIVSGSWYALVVAGDNDVVTNHGKMIGSTYGGITMHIGSNHAVITNDGEIYGAESGIAAGSHLEGGKINNVGAGLIHSKHSGIAVGTEAGRTTFITNGANATIQGTDYSVHTVLRGGIWLTNEGKLFGNLRCDASNEHDTVINSGTILGNVVLGSGDDRYNGQGGGLVTGNIQGGLGNDTLTAGVKHEVFYGQGGADTFDFRATSFSTPGAARDYIQDFSHAQGDKLDLHYIDADVTHAGKQGFVFIGADSFAHYQSLHQGVVGMLRFDAGLDRLQGNVNADFAAAEFEVGLPGVVSLSVGDLILV